MCNHSDLYFSISSVKFQVASSLELHLFNKMESCGCQESVTKCQEGIRKVSQGVRKVLLGFRKVFLGVRKVLLGVQKVLSWCYWVLGRYY